MDIKINMENYQSPYKNYIISCHEILKPEQMKNEYDIYLKQKISSRLVGKCYRDYGYVCEIYKILEESNCEIEDENLSGSAKIKLKISCKICLPIKNKEIICKIVSLNKEIIKGVNGPILFIIENNNINTNNFYIDINRNIRSSTTSQILSQGIYVRVLIDKIKINDNEKNIIAYGPLLSLATPDEIKLFNFDLQINDTETEAEQFN